MPAPGLVHRAGPGQGKCTDQVVFTGDEDSGFDIGTALDAVGVSGCLFRVTSLTSDATARNYNIHINAVGRWF